MNVGMLILQFLVLMAVVTGVIIFVQYKLYFASTAGALKRLDADTERVRTKQAELDKKIKEAEEELAKRKKEAEDLVKKMKEEAEESARTEREKMVKKARDESEEIIAKAQSTKDQIRIEIQKEMTLKTIDFASQLLNVVLSDKTKGALNDELIAEFLLNLEKMDVNQVETDVDSADVISTSPLSALNTEKLIKVIKTKMGRDIKINASVDPNIVGGIILRFGSLALDGSLQNMFREAGEQLKNKTERGE